MNLKHFLDKRNVAYNVLPDFWAASTAEVAVAERVPQYQVVKVVLLHADHHYRDLIVVVPADSRVDLEQVSRHMGGAQIELASAEHVAIRYPDCDPHQLPPFGSQYGMRTLADASLVGQEAMVVASNSLQEALQMQWQDFVRIENPLVGRFAIRE